MRKKKRREKWKCWLHSYVNVFCAQRQMMCWRHATPLRSFGSNIPPKKKSREKKKEKKKKRFQIIIRQNPFVPLTCKNCLLHREEKRGWRRCCCSCLFNLVGRERRKRAVRERHDSIELQPEMCQHFLACGSVATGRRGITCSSRLVCLYIVFSPRFFFLASSTRRSKHTTRHNLLRVMTVTVFWRPLVRWQSSSIRQLLLFFLSLKKNFEDSLLSSGDLFRSISTTYRARAQQKKLPSPSHLVWHGVVQLPFVISFAHEQHARYPLRPIRRVKIAGVVAQRGQRHSISFQFGF